ncbi:hypothetical protein INR49_014098 [Caranx melampygus]|nr:hypothetical protein INR49_014098 [Caranx melampygus]
MDFLLDTCGRRRRLLLIYLFVLKAAANCPKPEGKENVVLTSQSLLKNEFPEGTVVTLECVHGHLIESGSDEMTCISGRWTEPELKCKKKDCGPPKSQPNMKFDLRNGTLFGAVMNVSCDKGYEISGMTFRQCLGDRWSGFSKCDIVVCEELPQVANGMTLWDSLDDPEYGEDIKFACKDGYTLIGHPSIMCSETGGYDREPPTCKGGRDTSTAAEGTTTASVKSTTSPQGRERFLEKPDESLSHFGLFETRLCYFYHHVI